MHIAFLTPEYSRDEDQQGGLGNYLRKVGLELCRRGHRVTILCLSSSRAEWQDNLIHVQEIKRFRFPYQLMRFRAVCPYLPAIAHVRSAHRLERALLKIHRRDRVDIAQASSYKAPGYTLRRNPHIPLVCRISSYTPLLRAACGQSRTFGEYLCDWLEVRQVLDADASFAPSEFMANTFARIEGHRPLTIRTPAILEGIALDSSFFDCHLRNKKYLLYFGTLNRIKGVDLLAPVISAVLGRHPMIQFVFVGRDHGLGGGSRAFEVLRNANEEHATRLFYYPALSKSQLYPVIANSLGVLMPSRVDNYPNACLEAHALGASVVGTYDSRPRRNDRGGCNRFPGSQRRCREFLRGDRTFAGPSTCRQRPDATVDRLHDGLPRVRRSDRPVARNVCARRKEALQRGEQMSLTFVAGYRDREAERLRRSLDSLKGQTCPDFEVILLDYGSRSACGSQIRQLVAGYPFCRYYYSDTRGWMWNRSAALNTGARISDREFLFFSDVDIVYPPWFVERIRKHMAADLFLASECFRSPQGFQDWGALKDGRYGRAWPSMKGKGLLCCARRVLEAVGGLEEGFGWWGQEDIDLVERLTRLGLRDAELPNLYCYHQWHPKCIYEMPLSVQFNNFSTGTTGRRRRPGRGQTNAGHGANWSIPKTVRSTSVLTRSKEHLGQAPRSGPRRLSALQAC